MAVNGDLDESIAGMNLDDLIQKAAERHGHISKSSAPGSMAPKLPPSIAGVKNVTTEEFLKAMNKMPLFMTELDETGEDGGENLELEALKALAYEGEPHEVWFALPLHPSSPLFLRNHVCIRLVMQGTNRRLKQVAQNFRTQGTLRTYLVPQAAMPDMTPELQATTTSK